MSTNTVRTLVSADSHVIEPIEMWDGLFPDGYWDHAVESFAERPGGFDPKARIEEMEVDGVSAEVLYPSLAMKLFTEPETLQRECFTRYNDWMAEYCAVSPERLIGIGLLAAHDIDQAIAEAQRCKELGLRGLQVWQSPPEELAFNTGHYEPLWEACASLDLPMNLHILTGYGYPEAVYNNPDTFPSSGDFAFRMVINQKLRTVMDAVTEILLSGAFDRHPNFKLMLVENEVGWLPFFIDQLDYYYKRFESRTPITLERLPSEIFRDQIFATFFRDPHAATVATTVDNVMWSSDYPHGNSTWPKSQEVVESRLGHLPESMTRLIVQDTVCDLYHIDIAAILADAAR